MENVDANSREFKVPPIKPTHIQNNIIDIIELAKPLTHPGYLKKIIEKIPYYNQENGKDVYMKAVVEAVEQDFNFTDKEFLKKTVIEYFEKIYEKGEWLRQYLSPGIRFKLRDCNGRDIYGNGNVCSYNSALELCRRELENETFVAFGGIFDSEKVKELSTRTITNGATTSFSSLSVPYKHFNESGQCIYDSKEEDRRENERIAKRDAELAAINNQITECDQKIEDLLNRSSLSSHTSEKRIQVRIQDRPFSLSQQEYNTFSNLIEHKNQLVDKYNKIVQGKVPPRTPTPINFLATNDLSSRIRTQVSYLVWATNINDWIRNNRFLSPSALQLIEITKAIQPRIEHTIYFTEAARNQSINALQLFRGASECSKNDFIFASLGISFAIFQEKELKSPKKHFFNEMTIRPQETAWIDLALGSFSITTPFSTTIGQAGFNDHARLILQY
ncbi:MAG: hypothetical protein LBS71_00310 [Puniceicoccales bacterium]|nr:hypothetical protein [Puniceicoccales bacterium]